MKNKKVILLLTIVCTIAIAVLSLVNLNKLEVDLSSGRDKIAHAFAYAVLTLLWFFSFYKTFNYPKFKALVCAVLLVISYGLLLEVLQNQLTNYRVLDYKDALANTVGALITALLLTIKYKTEVKK